MYRIDSFRSNWIQLNFLGLAAASGGWTANEPGFQGSWFSRNWFTHENRDGSWNIRLRMRIKMVPETIYSRGERWFSTRWFTHEYRDGSWNVALLTRTEMVLETLVYSQDKRWFSKRWFTTRIEMNLETLVYSREQRWFLKRWFTHETRDGDTLVYTREQRWFSKRWCIAVQSPDAAASPRKVCFLIILLVNNIKYRMF